MKRAAFTRHMKQRLRALDLTYADVARYLRVAPSTVSRKMAGKSPWKHDEAEAIKTFLQMDEAPENHEAPVDDPAIGTVHTLLTTMPHPDRKDVYQMIVLVVAAKQSRLKPPGQEAYRALCTFAR